ncbi:hypothetical protein V1524DRAFT_386228 [Lipomyces starkeyi]
MANQPRELQSFKSKPRVFILSDISNEPDDAESLVRYLLYSNQFQTKGLVGVTSTWLKRKVHPEDMEKIVRAYGLVVDNLNAHVCTDFPYPSAQSLLDLIRTGPELYGKEALGPDIPLSSGAKLLVEVLDESEEPLWVLCWGGTNVLAQMLHHISDRSPEESAKLRSKLRVYAISDQDDTGMFIRLQFPDIFYISSVHGWNQYGLAAWTGISGDKYYGFDQGGPDFSTFTKEWIKEHIQIGPLGKAYPDYQFIPEGDTPTFLYLIQNGLNVPEHPEWGSWGGRYILTDINGAGKHYTDAVDRVVGLNGNTYLSNHATIWRWREAFQYDFAARIQWTLQPDFAKANHAPVIVLNGITGTEPLFLDADAGSDITLDASKSWDPDEKDSLEFFWYPYKDVTATQWWVDAEVATLGIEALSVDNQIVKLTLPPPEKCCVDLFTRTPQKQGQSFHLILEVKDNGTPPLRTYKRIVIQALNEDLKGGGGPAAEFIADVKHD